MPCKSSNRLYEDLPDNAPSGARVIIMYDENTDIIEGDWLQAASKNDAFNFLNDETEVYTLETRSHSNHEI